MSKIIKVSEDYYLDLSPSLIYFPFYHRCGARVLIEYVIITTAADKVGERSRLTTTGWRCCNCKILCDEDIIKKAKFILNQEYATI